MQAKSRKRQPRRRRPRDPRIAGASHAADVARQTIHPDSQTPDARTLADASQRGTAVLAYYHGRPRVIDGRTGRPPVKRHTRRITGRVTTSFDPTLRPGPPPSPWDRP